MTYNDLKKLNSNAAMELLTDKMKEARDTLHPMLICGEMPEMDKLLEWMNLASLSKAFALSVLQEEVEATATLVACARQVMLLSSCTRMRNGWRGPLAAVSRACSRVHRM